MNQASEILARFPKMRPELPAQYEDIYQQIYQENRNGTAAANRISLLLERWMHHQAAQSSTFPLLELGAGTLNHIPFELGKPGFEMDVVEPQSYLFRDSVYKNCVRNFFSDMQDVPTNNMYARIISIAVLEHLDDLPFIVAQSALRLESGGEFFAGIPSEGSFAWWLAWRFGTGLPFRLRYGLSYKTWMKFEHINTAPEIETVIRYFFDHVERKRFFLPFFHGSIYTSIRAYEPIRERAEAYIRTRSA